MSADGSWSISLNTQMGVQEATLDLVTDGTTLTGTMTNPGMGTLVLNDGTVDGDSLTWTAQMTTPMQMDLAFSATIDGDLIAGEVTIGLMGSANFNGQRV